jgi:mRNA-degrading endonuclease RelE of RelBE toxin-antitoxin system
MVKVTYTDKFEKEFKKVDGSIKEKALKQIKKIIENPEFGKPLRYDLKGERTIYVKPYRIIYAFFDEEIQFLRFEYRKEVYE